MLKMLSSVKTDYFNAVKRTLISNAWYLSQIKQKRQPEYESEAAALNKLLHLV